MNEKYQILKEISKSTTCTVFTAKDITTNTLVCCKVISKSDEDPKKHKRLVYKEINVLKLLQHDNIVKYLDHYEDDDNYYIFTEFCGGESLQTLIDKNKGLNENQLIILFKQIVTAVAYIHKKGVGHRDLKPENIIVSQNNKIKIIDFGLSTDDNHYLRTTFCGSLAFAAPECITKDPYFAHKADAWSLGVILFMMATGKTPWKANNILNMVKQITTCNFQVPRSVPLDIVDTICSLLVRNPDERMSAEQILEQRWLKKERCAFTNVKMRNPYSLPEAHKSLNKRVSGISPTFFTPLIKPNKFNRTDIITPRHI